MSDRDRVLEALTGAGANGVHSLDIRRQGLSGNPSQRIAELRALGYAIDAKSEHRGGRNGTRYTLIDVGLFDGDDYRERLTYGHEEAV